MAYPVDPSGDWSIVEGIEPVSFKIKLDEGVYSQPIATQGKMMPLSKREIEMGDADLITYGVIWHVWKALLPAGTKPKWGDKIVNAAGEEFVINPTTDVVSLATRFRCVTLRIPGTFAGA